MSARVLPFKSPQVQRFEQFIENELPEAEWVLCTIKRKNGSKVESYCTTTPEVDSDRIVGALERLKLYVLEVALEGAEERGLV